MVLVHSAGHDHRDFDAVVPELARGFRTIAIDLPGFGESEGPDQPLETTSELYTGVLEDVVEKLGLGKAIFVGNSVGGSAAIRLALRRPELVRALVPVDSGGFTTPGLAMRMFCFVQGRRWIRRATGRRFARFYFERRTPLVEEIITRVGEAGPVAIDTHAGLWRSFARPENDLRKDAANVRCPTLFVWGSHDPVTRAKRDGQNARATLPEAGFVELPTGHVPFAEDPQAFLAAVEPFLGALS
jgi:3-oxoadipate enol-lactonase